MTDKVSDIQHIVLRHIGEQCLKGAGAVDIRTISEPYRQRAIDLGMMEPPLVDIEGDFLFVTYAGWEHLTTGIPS